MRGQTCHSSGQYQPATPPPPVSAVEVSFCFRDQFPLARAGLSIKAGWPGASAVIMFLGNLDSSSLEFDR